MKGREPMTMKRLKTSPFLAVAVAAALGLGLSACGGGGGSSPTATTPPPTPTPTPTACETSMTSQACVDEKKTARDAAKTALDAAKADQNSTLAQIAAAQTAYDAAVKAYDDAMKGRAAYVAMQPPMYDTADKLKAMATAIGSPTTPLEGGLATVDNTSSSPIDGGEVTVTGGTPSANTYSKATWPVPSITGWAGSVWERTNSPKDSVVVYTNIEAAKGEKWSVFYASTPPTADTPVDGFSWSVRTAGISSVTDAGVMSFGRNVAASSKLFSAAGFPDGKGRAITYPDNDDNTENTYKVEFAGMFHGVAGTFKCGNTSACSATNNADGELMMLSDGWTFTPTSTDSMVADVRSDADYMDFGYWVNTDDSGDSVAYKVNTFARGAMPASLPDNLEGSATYKGGAAGLYSKRVYAPDGKGTVTAAGRFTADAELTAYFGGDKVAVANQNSISGTIKNFMDGSNVIDAAWSVELNKIKQGTTGQTWSNGTFTGGTTTGSGSWSGAFYGTATAAVGDTKAVYPSGVAGQFDAKFNNGDVIGAFGATKQ